MVEKGQTISQTTRPQNAIAAGTAIARPRAKLRLGPNRGSRDTECLSSGDDLVMATTLSIMNVPLLLLGDLIQPANMNAPPSTRDNSRMLPMFPARTRARRRSHALAAMARDTTQLTRLALHLTLTRGERRERAVHHVIYVASGRPRQGKPAIAARFALLLALFAAPRMAAAQEDVTTPTEIFEAEKGRGISLSPGLVLYNQTLIEGHYDTNIYNVEQNRIDDTIGVVDSDFRLATRLSRHELEVLSGATIRRYADVSDENSETYYLTGRAFLDLGARIGLRASGGYERGIERRGTAGDQFATDRPVRFDSTRMEVGIDRTGGILEAALAGSIQRRKFLDASINGVTIDLGRRDATIRKASLKTSYRLSPVLRLHAELGANKVDYHRNTGTSRDSSGYSVLAGIRYEVTRLVDVTAAVGFIRQNFDAPDTKAATGLNYRLAATWTPTPMWRLTASGERTVDASPLDDVPAIVRSDFDLKVQRALGRRVLVEAGVSYTDEDYRGVGGTDRRYAGYGNVQYRVTENIAAVVGAEYRKQAGGASRRDYSGAAFSAGVRIAF
jgi:polysaccharide biosynthesis protein VpsM